MTDELIQDRIFVRKTKIEYHITSPPKLLLGHGLHVTTRPIAQRRSLHPLHQARLQSRSLLHLFHDPLESRLIIHNLQGLDCLGRNPSCELLIA